MDKFSPVLVGITLLCIAWSSPDPEGPRVTGPYAHENLAVYLIHDADRRPEKYITLDEGLRQGWVSVSEMNGGEVGRLQIENRSGRSLFLQEGDCVRGGRQDRIIGLTLIIPPRTRMTAPAFCVERARWSRGALGDRFAMTRNDALAPVSVRIACKVGSDQGDVWKRVAEHKKLLESIGVSNRSSSLTEAMDSGKIRTMVGEYVDELGGIFSTHPDAVGIAFAINGKVVEVDIYPAHDLLGKIGPRLLKGYAVQSVVAGRQGVQHPDASAIAGLIGEKAPGSHQSREIGGGGSLRLANHASGVRCDTTYKGRSVHRQWFVAPGAKVEPGGDPSPDVPRRPVVRPPAGRQLPGGGSVGGEKRPPLRIPRGR
jgi:hypothetical protein